MKSKLIIGFLLVSLIAVPLFAVACEEEEPTPPAQQEEEVTPPAEEEEEEEVDWWEEKWGEPKYGGTIIFGITPPHGTNFDVTSFVGAEWNLQYDATFTIDWVVDREEFSFSGSFTPDRYFVGNLVESWEWKDPLNLEIKIREGIHWQNKPPVNGREFTAYDIQQHYDRVMVSEVAPMYSGSFANWEKVTAIDNYTCNIEFKAAGAQNFQSVANPDSKNMIESPEYAALSEEERQDWRNAVGTSAWILEDFVAGTSMNYVKNPDYWGTDPRYPENELPYADGLTCLIIPEMTSRIAAIRTGQVDLIIGVDWKQASTIADSNPELVQVSLPAWAYGIQPRLDVAPFTDIRVRKALNMAIDRDAIVENYYGGFARENVSGNITPDYVGYAYAYEDWPQELKDEYAYNPEMARQLLAEAAADGVFEPNELGGFDTTLEMSSDFDTQLAEIWKANLADIGIDMEIVVYDPATMESVSRGGQIKQLSYSTHSVTFPPDRAMQKFWSGGPDAATSGIADAHYDALYQAFLAATDVEESMEIVVEADKYVIESHFTILGNEYRSFSIWQPYLKGYSGEFMKWGFGPYFARLWLD